MFVSKGEGIEILKVRLTRIERINLSLINNSDAKHLISYLMCLSTHADNFGLFRLACSSPEGVVSVPRVLDAYSEA